MSGSGSLSERKRTATRERIAGAAAQLVVDNGLADTTVEKIAQEAEVGRATFFRYFASKEDAVAEGTTRRWLDQITTTLAAQPAELSAIDAVVGAFAELADGISESHDQIRELAILTRSSSALNAWTLNVYVNYENAIAALLAPRLSGLVPDDPRPRLIGALAMAAVRIALDDWLVHGGDLTQRVHGALRAVTVREAAR